ncbi:hypothetical protein [Lutibacter sp.]
MSFGGSVSAMISSIKNNTRAKRKTYFDRKTSSFRKRDKKNVLDEKKTTPEQLANIREKLAKENRKKSIKTALFIVFIAILIILLLVYIN